MATKFHSPKYRGLLVKMAGQRVKFDHGVAEVPDDLLARFEEWANANPEYGVVRAEDGELTDDKPKLTAKQQAVADAKALGLDASGTTAEILARIEASKADESDESDDSSDEDESEDQSDDQEGDEAGEADSSEDDEK